ncbi:MAG: glycosyl hydrolase family 28-related protein [Cyanobacteria bacterium P01_A01_bin.84]
MVITAVNISTPPAPPDAKGVDIRKYGAIPNDGKDDTAAIQKALDDKRRDANGKPVHENFYGRTKFLYFPKGTYNVSDTIDWIGCAVTLNGDGNGKTIFKLKDNAKGFNNSKTPKPVFRVPNGNDSFRQNIWNLSINTGKGNVGAMGIDYNSSNQGSMENVTITSGDGKGHTGLAMYDGLPGPLLIKNVAVNGFDTGIGVSGDGVGVVLKNIELTNQNKRAISAHKATLTIHRLKSNNSVPVIDSNHWSGMITLVDGNFQGGSSNISAIESKGQLYIRNVNTNGYFSAIKHKNRIIAGTKVKEYASKTSQLFNSSVKKSLNLPIKDIPEFNDSNLDNWGRFKPRWYGDTNGLQKLLNSGKSTIYFPADIYFSYNQKVVTVPPTVRKIIGFSSTVNGSKKGKRGGGIKFVIKEDSKNPLIVEGFGYGIRVSNQAARDVVLKNGKYNYIDGPGVGDLYLEDIQIRKLKLRDTKNVYAWQLNTESLDKARLKVINNGANMVIFGIKTEGKGTIIETTNGGKTEVLGGFILPTRKFSTKEKKDPAFRSIDSETSISIRFRYYHDPNYMYNILVEETRDGVTRRIKNSKNPHQFVPLYSGNQTTGTQLAKDSNNFSNRLINRIRKLINEIRRQTDFDGDRKTEKKSQI